MNTIRVCTGCDIVLVERVAALLLHTTAVQKIFHKSELLRPDAQHAAGIFAVKEAAGKALGLPAGSWLDMEVLHEQTGKPYLSFASTELTKNIVSIDCSISHDGAYAFAVVTALLVKE